jgi:hypothetical protein
MFLRSALLGPERRERLGGDLRRSPRRPSWRWSESGDLDQFSEDLELGEYGDVD